MKRAYLSPSVKSLTSCSRNQFCSYKQVSSPRLQQTSSHRRAAICNLHALITARFFFFFKKTSHLFSIHNSKRKKLVGWTQMLPKFIVPNAKKYHWTFNQRAKRKEAKKKYLRIEEESSVTIKLAGSPRGRRCPPLLWPHLHARF